MSATATIGQATALSGKATQFARNKLHMAHAIKATRIARTKATVVGKAAAGTASKHPGQVGGLLATTFSSPAMYHGMVKVAAVTAKYAVGAVSLAVHAVSKTVGAIGYAASKLVGYLFPAGGKFIQSLTWSATDLITRGGIQFETMCINAINFTYSVLVSPTVTRAVTRVATSIGWLMFIQFITRGRSAMLLARIPVVGPYLAAVSLGGRAVWITLRAVIVLSTLWGLIMRPTEMAAVYNGDAPAPSFKDEIKSEFNIRKAAKTLIEEAEATLAEAAHNDPTTDFQSTDTAEEIIEITTDPEDTIVAAAMTAEADSIVRELRRPTGNQPRQRKVNHKNRRRVS